MDSQSLRKHQRSGRRSILEEEKRLSEGSFSQEDLLLEASELEVEQELHGQEDGFANIKLTDDPSVTIKGDTMRTTANNSKTSSKARQTPSAHAGFDVSSEQMVVASPLETNLGSTKLGSNWNHVTMDGWKKAEKKGRNETSDDAANSADRYSKKLTKKEQLLKSGWAGVRLATPSNQSLVNFRDVDTSNFHKPLSSQSGGWSDDDFRAVFPHLQTKEQVDRLRLRYPILAQLHLQTIKNTVRGWMSVVGAIAIEAIEKSPEANKKSKDKYSTNETPEESNVDILPETARLDMTQVSRLLASSPDLLQLDLRTQVPSKLRAILRLLPDLAFVSAASVTP